MRFTAKLEQLSEGKNKALYARKVGLKPTLLSDYIKKGYSPRADIALKMARAFEVPVEWLIDDSQGWPPPKEGRTAASQLSDDELMRELVYRRRLAQLDLLAKLRRAKKVNWADVRKRLESLSNGAPIPTDLHARLSLISMVDFQYTQLFALFDPHFNELAFRDELPGDVSANEISASNLMEGCSELYRDVDYNWLSDQMKHDQRLRNTPQSESVRDWIAKVNQASQNVVPADDSAAASRKPNKRRSRQT